MSAGWYCEQVPGLCTQGVGMTKHKNKPKPNPQQKKDKFALMVESCVQNVK